MVCRNYGEGKGEMHRGKMGEKSKFSFLASSTLPQGQAPKGGGVLGIQVLEALEQRN